MSTTDIENDIQKLRSRAESTAKTHQREAADIDADTSRTAEWKQQAKQEANRRSREVMSALRDEEKQLIENALQRVKRSLAGGSSYGTGLEAIAQRDADERANRLDSDKDARDMIRRALQNNDTTLVRAILARALDSEYQQTVAEYLTVHPNDRSKFEDFDRLTALSQGQGARMQRTMLYGALSFGR